MPKADIKWVILLANHWSNLSMFSFAYFFFFNLQGREIICHGRWGILSLSEVFVWVLSSMKCVTTVLLSGCSIVELYNRRSMSSLGLAVIEAHCRCSMYSLKKMSSLWHVIYRVCDRWGELLLCYVILEVCHRRCMTMRYMAMVTDNFGLFTEIDVCKFLRGWRSYGLKPSFFSLLFFLFFPLYVFLYIFLQLFVRRIVP